jgi:mRNA interferase MazF
MQFHQAAGANVRPALVLLDTGDDDFVAAPITSQLKRTDYDLTLEDWRKTGLNVPSCVRVHKLTVLPKADIARHLAVLSARDAELVRKALCGAFCPELSGL